MTLLHNLKSCTNDSQSTKQLQLKLVLLLPKLVNNGIDEKNYHRITVCYYSYTDFCALITLTSLTLIRRRSDK